MDKELKLRPIVQTIIEDPELAKVIIEHQSHNATKEEVEYIRKQTELFEGMYISRF